MKEITLILAVMVFGLSAISHANINTDNIQGDLSYVYYKYKNYQGGENASYIPILKRVDSSLFAIVVVTVDGTLWEVGDADRLFAIESISKLFTYALALQDNGAHVNELIGLNATGSQFNSVMALEQQTGHRQNPFVNAGAIQVMDYIRGESSAEKWGREINFISKLSNNRAKLGIDYYLSESQTNQHNLGIALLLSSYGLIKGDAYDALDRYTKACSIVVTAKQLAIMGSVFANGGVHPITHQRLIMSKYVKNVLSQMVINGMYENSGIWWTEVGVPAKSGVGGAILAIVPNKMAIVVYSPPLDSTGNSVKGQLVMKELSRKWNLHLFAQT